MNRNLIAFACIAGVLALVSGCAKSPSSVVRNMLKECAAGKAETAKEYCTDNAVETKLFIAGSVDRIKSDKTYAKLFKDSKVVKKEINGDRATVTIRLTSPKKLELLQAGDDWKIDEIGQY